MSENTGKVNLNPLFKKQLALLKAVAKSEYNIHISLDKMAHEKEYRDTVLNELSELNDDTLNKPLAILKRVEVYSEPAAPSFSFDALPSLSPAERSEKRACNNNQNNNPFKFNEKTKKVNFFGIVAALMLLVSIFFTWQSGYLQISLKQPIAHARQANINSVEASILSPPKTSNKQAPQILEKRNTITQQGTVNPPTQVSKPINLPSKDRIISLRLHGSNTVGENLAPALFEAYLQKLGIKEMLWVEGKEEVERELQYIQGGQVYAIELHAHGSSTGFKSLLNEQADMAMSSRKIRDKEISLLQPMYGDLGQDGQEYIIGLDGLAMIVNPYNPINELTSPTLARIFAGEISNWNELGGPDLAINVYARDENSGTWDTFNNLVLKANKKQIASSAIRYESSGQLSQQVSNDLGAIGFIGLPYINNSKAISIAESDITTSIYPTSFTVSTEDYPLSRRLYMYAPAHRSELVKEFANFVISDEGQAIVEQIGLISQNIKLENIYSVKNAPPNYNNYIDIAKRLSVNFRFQSSSNELDNKGKRDLSRLVRYMENNRGRRLVLMGFSDSLGDPVKNIKLSRLRANAVEEALAVRGINVIAVEGFGEQLPIASNRNALGRSKNRRVEVWFF